MSLDLVRLPIGDNIKGHSTVGLNGSPVNRAITNERRYECASANFELGSEVAVCPNDVGDSGGVRDTRLIKRNEELEVCRGYEKGIVRTCFLSGSQSRSVSSYLRHCTRL